MQIFWDVNLKKYNTFVVPSVAKLFCTVQSISDIENMITTTEFQQNKRYFLGQWANTVFVNDFGWLVVKIHILWKEVISEDDNCILIRVWAGEVWHDFVSRCANQDIVWMENLAYIPSSIWATAVQNIWAYWAQAQDIIYQVEWFDLQSWTTKILRNDECHFSYRDSIFKHELSDNFIVTHVIYKLQKFSSSYRFNSEYVGIKEKINELWFDIPSLSPKDFVQVITEIRKSKLPDWHEIGTAWSFFKNPVIGQNQRLGLQKQHPELKWFDVDWWVKLSAGQLIDLCGYKWKDNGKVWTYSKHALVLINKWEAKWSDVLSFSTEIQNSVFQKFWVHLEPEAILVE